MASHLKPMPPAPHRKPKAPTRLKRQSAPRGGFCECPPPGSPGGVYVGAEGSTLRWLTLEELGDDGKALQQLIGRVGLTFDQASEVFTISPKDFFRFNRTLRRWADATVFCDGVSGQTLTQAQVFKAFLRKRLGRRPGRPRKSDADGLLGELRHQRPRATSGQLQRLLGARGVELSPRTIRRRLRATPP